MIFRKKPESFEEFAISKYHNIIKEKIRSKINESNFEIEFIEPTFVIKELCGKGGYMKITKILQQKFGVVSIEKDEEKQCSIINVWTDGVEGGYSCRLINVPNGLFKIST